MTNPLDPFDLQAKVRSLIILVGVLILVGTLTSIGAYVAGLAEGYDKGYSAGRTAGVTEILKHIKAGSE